MSSDRERSSHRHRSRSRERDRHRDLDRGRDRDRDRHDEEKYRYKDDVRGGDGYGSVTRNKRRRDDDGGGGEDYDDDERERRRDKHKRDKDRDRDRDRGRDKGKDREKKHHKEKKRETSEERRARKMARRERRAISDEDNKFLQDPNDDDDPLPLQAGISANNYTATSNPFNDVNLGTQFVWSKKKEKERKMGLSELDARRRDSERRKEAAEELTKLNQRRQEREAEEELREEESLRMARLAESAQMTEWLEKEDEFHLEQARRRAEIRVKANRAKAIDLLAMNLKWSVPKEVRRKQWRGEKGDGGVFGNVVDEDEDEEDEGAGLDVDLEEPYMIFENLGLNECLELHEDIKMYLSLETFPSSIEFWTALLVVSKSQIERLSGNQPSTARNKTILREIEKLLQGKTYDQLVALQGSVERKLKSDEKIDVEYWEGLKDELKVWIAKAKLRNMHELVLQNRLEQLRRRQRDQAHKFQSELAASASLDPSELAARAIMGADDMDVDLGAEADGLEDEQEDEEEEPEEWDDAEMAPKLVERLQLGEERELDLIDEKAERDKLYSRRREVSKTRFVPIQNRPSAVQSGPSRSHEVEVDENGVGTGGGDGSMGGGGSKTTVIDRDAMEEALYKAEVEKGFDEEEELFDEVVEANENWDAVGTKVYSWEDKYRPRKPRYFNKVHTGYEWNKYNQTHYDTDNPPPKVVQGYKFSIFYPDLIDKRKAPTYKIIKEKGNDDTCILLFQAGPPYEDIAFRIVNREWSFGKKSGFRSTFDRGVLQLHVNFKRHYYRK